MISRKIALNATATFSARIVVAAVNIATIPLYVSYLGEERYGLIAFVVTLQNTLSLLDLGLAMTANREVSRLLGQGDLPKLGTLVHTLTTLYWYAAIVVFVVLGLGASPIGGGWFAATSIPQTELVSALLVAAASIAIRWPVAAYNGILQGREMQVIMNLIFTLHAIAKAGGGLVLLAMGTRQIEILFGWYAVVGTSETLVARRFALRGILSTTRRVEFDWQVVREVWRFAISFSIVGALGTLASQMDRLLIARFLHLSDLGVYAMMGSIAMLLPTIGSAVTTAVFPQFVRSAGAKGESSSETLVRKATDTVARAVTPVVLPMVFFARPLVEAWTGSAEIARESEPILILLAAGGCVNALNNSAYTMLVALGDTRWLLLTNLAILMLLLPYYLYVIPTYGVVIAATGWLLHNLLLFVSCDYGLRRHSEKATYSKAHLRLLAEWAGAMLLFWAASSLLSAQSLAMKIGFAGALTLLLFALMNQTMLRMLLRPRTKRA